MNLEGKVYDSVILCLTRCVLAYGHHAGYFSISLLCMCVCISKLLITNDVKLSLHQLNKLYCFSAWLAQYPSLIYLMGRELVKLW